MNLLTPESFSSPGRKEETNPTQKEVSLVDLDNATPTNTPSPSEVRKNSYMSF